MKLTLFSLCFFALINLRAQERLLFVDSICDLSFKKDVYFPNNHIRFKDFGETWFSTTSDLVNIGEIPPLSIDPLGQKAFLVSVFPDSTIILGIDPSTGSSYRPSVHGIADIINPSNTPSNWVNKWADVLIDSLSIPFVYTRSSNDFIVDTMFVDYIKSIPDNLLVYYDLNKNNSADFGEFLHQPLFHSDLSSNKLDSIQVFRTDTILLTPDDSSFSDNYRVRFKEIDVNDIVLQSDRYGIYIRFEPGYEWSLNDTINEFNELLLLAREQKKQELPRQIWSLSAGFCSYTMTSNVRYNKGINSNYLIPGIYPISNWSLEHLIVSYKLTSEELSLNELKKELILKLYPNPVNDVLNISFSVKKIKDLEIFVVDVTGREVFSDIIYFDTADLQLYTLNTENLTPGIYSIKIGNISDKFVVK